MTSPGPCRFHCGSGVKVGGTVDVGRGVSEGGTVGVSVGNTMGVIVGWVADEDGLAVQVNSIVGVRGTIRVNPPQPSRSDASADIPTNVFRKLL